MKTLIVGTGNIGLIYGWALWQSGTDICHVVRKGSLAKYSGDVKMDVLDMRGDVPTNYLRWYRPRITDSPLPKDGYELALVATNHLQVESAVQQYRELAPRADFLMFTANWEGTEKIDALLSPSRYLWGYSVSSGGRDRDGVLYANVQKEYRIGEPTGSRTQRLDGVIEMFRKAGLVADVKPNIMEWLWVHHAINSGVIGTTLSMGGLPEKDTGIEVWVLMVRAVKDALAVLEKRGVNVRAYADTKPYLLSDEWDTANRFRQMMFSMPHYERTKKCSHFNTSPEEMKRFYLDVLETGECLGVSMPYLGSLKKTICSGT